MRRRDYRLNDAFPSQEMSRHDSDRDAVFCADEGADVEYTIKAYGPHYDKNGVFKIGVYSKDDGSTYYNPLTNPEAWERFTKGTTQQTITDLVHEVIVQRERIGMATYHRPLTAFDGRDTLQDAIEEAADLLQYLVKLKVERDKEYPDDPLHTP